MTTICEFQSYKRSEDDADNYMPKVYCKKNKDVCYSQKPCQKEGKWVVSEHAHLYCRDFKFMGQ